MVSPMALTHVGTRIGTQKAKASVSLKELEIHHISPSAWMVTFSDLLTLLLTFFVMLHAMSSIDNQQIILKLKHFSKHQLEQAKEAIGKGGNDLMDKIDAAIPSSRNEKTQLTARVASKLQGALGAPNAKSAAGNNLKFANDIYLRSTSDNGSLLLLGASTFPMASDELSFSAKEAVIAISRALSGKKVSISVNGHTDSTPINNSRFASNWELSAARAIAVVRQMIDAGIDPNLISAVGYADTKPLIDDNLAQYRHQNRRVEIYVAPTEQDGKKKEKISN
ncbi:MAG: flagellar motor protein MotB [Deltaproteobacteria bacterium]|nr:flagellar motor protein MotB [Deltaproteobacteria bacterium]